MVKLLLKYFALFVLIILGTTLGIVFGYKAIGGNNKDEIIYGANGQMDLPNSMKLKFSVGDKFPDFQLTGDNNLLVNTGDMLIGKRSALIFSSANCKACPEYFQLWNQIVTQKLAQNCQELVILPLKDTNSFEVLASYLTNKKTFFSDYDAIKREFNVTVIPTTIILDENLVVKHIQYGNPAGIDYEILKFITTHNI